uniref:Uncharacterized protein n=1 Tax=Ditylenchus dipsaci TaxID=166011 RepID=A0A915DVF6_9BILA
MEQEYQEEEQNEEHHNDLPHALTVKEAKEQLMRNVKNPNDVLCLDEKLDCLILRLCDSNDKEWVEGVNCLSTFSWLLKSNSADDRCLLVNPNPKTGNSPWKIKKQIKGVIYSWTIPKIIHELFLAGYDDYEWLKTRGRESKFKNKNPVCIKQPAQQLCVNIFHWARESPITEIESGRAMQFVKKGVVEAETKLNSLLSFIKNIVELQLLPVL